MIEAPFKSYPEMGYEPGLQPVYIEFDAALFAYSAGGWGFARASASGLTADATERAATWNQFQKMTAGQFSSRTEASAAWSAYKQSNNIIIGTVRNQAQKSLFLKDAAESGIYQKWMNQWLKKGELPPSYHVDHIKPLSIGGEGIPSNMRLLDIDFHIDIHHKYYRPWQY